MTKAHSTDLPKYLQISETLIRDISAGILPDGARLPPERELAEQMGTSVGTLRKALAETEARGLLQRIHGSGNYVQAGKPTDSIYGMFRLELPQGGGLPRARFLDVAEMEKPSDLPPFGTSSRATRMRRLRRLDQTIVALEEVWLDASIGVLGPDQVSESLYHTYRKTLGVQVTRAEDRVSVGPVPAWAPPEFPLAAGVTCGFVERLSWTSEIAAIEFSRTWFDPSSAVYVQRLG